MLLNPNLLNSSFYLSFLALTASSVLTGLNLVDEKQNEWKTILSLETTVTIIAAIIYYMFINYINQPNKSLKLITNLRYLDWVITTPLLLISFCLYLHYEKEENKEKPVGVRPLFWIILFNFGMLLFGYLGESNLMNTYLANGLGFVCLFLFLWFIHKKYVSEQTEKEFIIFSFLWILYGVVYFFPTNAKNLGYNLLDIFAKGGFALYFLYKMKSNNKKND